MVFIGWIRAGNVVGLDEALSRYQIDAIGVVGLRYQNLQLVDNLQDRCGGAKVFYLQGGFEPNKLKGLNRLIIKIAAKTMVKNLKRKNPRNADEESMLEMLQKGGSRVTMEALDPMVHALRDPQD